MKKIAIVDNSYTARFLIKKELLKLSSEIEFIEAHDGSAAYGIIKDQKFVPDLIILSLKLQKMNGITLLKKAVKNNLICSIPVIIIAENGEKRFSDLLRNCRLLGVISKPVSSEDIKAVTGEIQWN